MVRDPARLHVFELAHQLVLHVYRVSSSMPAAERFGLQAQIRRAAVSIPSNLVEGCARSTSREYERFIEIAHGSAVEVRYLLRLAKDLGMTCDPALSQCQECSDHVVRALHQLRRAAGRFQG